MAELFTKKKKGAPAEEQALSNFVPLPASVNIIPRGVLSGYKIKAIRRRFVGAAVAMVLILGGVYGTNMFLNSGEDEQLASLNAQATQVRTEATRLAPYQTFFQDVERKRGEIAEKMASDTDLSAIFNSMHSVANQSGVTLGSVSLTVSGSSGGRVTCPSPDPWGAADTIGCITFEGRTGDRVNIATFVNTLNATPGFVNAYVPSSSTSAGKDDGPSVSSVSGTVSFTADFFTGRYTHLSLPLSSVLAGETSTPEGTEEAPGDEPTGTETEGTETEGTETEGTETDAEVGTPDNSDEENLT